MYCWGRGGRSGPAAVWSKTRLFRGARKRHGPQGGTVPRRAAEIYSCGQSVMVCMRFVPGSDHGIALLHGDRGTPEVSRAYCHPAVLSRLATATHEVDLHASIDLVVKLKTTRLLRKHTLGTSRLWWHYADGSSCRHRAIYEGWIFEGAKSVLGRWTPGTVPDPAAIRYRMPCAPTHGETDASFHHTGSQTRTRSGETIGPPSRTRTPIPDERVLGSIRYNLGADGNLANGTAEVHLTAWQ